MFIYANKLFINFKASLLLQKLYSYLSFLHFLLFLELSLGHTVIRDWNFPGKL
jgi:hypothetical protein